MRYIYVYISIFLHVTLLGMSYFQFEHMFSKAIKDNGHAVFDFVTLGAKSKAPVLSKETNKASKQKSHTDDKDTVMAKNQPEEVAPIQKIEQKKTEEKPIKKTEQSNKKQISKNDNKVVKLKNKNNKKMMEKQSKNKTNKVNKKQNKSQSKTNKASDKALVNLHQNKKNSIKSDTKSAKKKFNSLIDSVLATGDNENSGANAEELGDTLTATQIDLVRQTIRKCWHFPAGLKDAETLAVDIKMELDPNGYVKKAEIIDKARMKSDSGFRIAAENAYRAVVDPECNPLPLPKDKYKEWKNLELNFNPKDMLS